MPAFLLNNFLYLLLIALINIVVLFMPKRNENGTKILGQIKRFRNSIKYIEKDKLRELIKEDKDYIANIFPYAYTLGVANRLLDVYTAVDKRGPKYVKMLNDRDARKNFNFLRKVTNNLDRRKGDEYY
jgi:Sec-independent protein translocase protein TatA